jgi:hypothetical protein
MAFFIATPVVKPTDIVPSLAKGEAHWRKGYSAYELVTSVKLV